MAVLSAPRARRLLRASHIQHRLPRVGVRLLAIDPPGAPGTFVAVERLSASKPAHYYVVTGRHD